MNLFVYGTLRRGEPAHALLRGAPLLAQCRTDPQFTLLDMGEYPALLEGGSTAVVGELYRVDQATLEELDRYEEAPELYLRVSRPIAGYTAQVYLLRPEHAAGRPLIASGDWAKR